MLESAMTTLPNCASIPIDKGIKSLFGKVGDAVGKLDLGVGDLSKLGLSDLKDMAGGLGLDLNSLSSFGIDALSKYGLGGLGDILGSALSQSTAIDVNLPAATEKKLDALKANIEAVQKSTKSTNENETCIQGIGKLVTKNLSQKLAISTVDWINTGFEGGPAFIQDTEKYFGDIAKNKILKFSSEIIDPKLSPFGTDSIKNTVTNFKSTFQDVAKYSLDDIMQATNPGFSTASFKEDFEQGGWDAWTEMTQNPANNPFGFKILAANELQKRLIGATQPIDQNVQNSLQASGGFLNDERCKEPKNLSKTEDAAGLLERSSNPTGPYTHSVCTGGWEVVTPGKMIADAATNVMGYQNDSYLNVADMNDAVTAISDVILNQFSSNVMQKGFANLGEQGADGSLVFGSRNNNPFKSKTEQDFTPLHLSSSWLSANPNFDIRTDLTQAMIDEQRTYSDKLAEQNKEISSTTDGKPYYLNPITNSSNAYGLLPVIYQLDYCIPGPHPGWEEDSRNILSKKLDSYPVGKLKYLKWAVNLPTNLKNTLREVVSDGDFFKMLMGTFTGGGAMTTPLNTRSDINQALDTAISSYARTINMIFFDDPEILPSIYREAATNFNQTKGYQQMLTNNENKIYSFKSTINMLQEIKDVVDKLNSDKKLKIIKDNEGKNVPETDQDAAYEEALKVQINAFGRLSQSMVNGDDIMAVDNLTKQIIDKRIYLYKDLLKGDYGCEIFLESKIQKNFPYYKNNINLKPENVNTHKRAEYLSTLPIIYDYNLLHMGDPIPDPEIFGSSLKKSRYMASPVEEGPSYFVDIADVKVLVDFSDSDYWSLSWERLFVPNTSSAMINEVMEYSSSWDGSKPFERMLEIY